MTGVRAIVLRRQREEYGKFSKAAGLLTQNQRTQVDGFGHSISGKVTATYNQLLTWGSGNATIGLRVYHFRNDIADGKINLNLDVRNQQNHISSPSWNNQYNQWQRGKQGPPKSKLDDSLDPQQIINDYAGKGNGYKFLGNNKYPEEYITLPYKAGILYDKVIGAFVETNRVQIKYNEAKGVHVFPALER